MIARLAWRSIWRNRRRTLITVSSIGLGLAIALFFISFADGVYEQLIDDIVRMQAGHITVEHPDYREAPSVDLWIENTDSLRRQLEKLPFVKSTKLLLLGQGVARSGAGSAGVAIVGVEPSVEGETSPLAGHLIAGGYLEDSDGPLAVVGSALARQLKLKEGKKLVLTTNDASGALVEELFRVKGIFESGSEEIDNALVQIPLDSARRLYVMPPESATQLGVILHDREKQKKILREIQEMIQGKSGKAFPWEEVMPEVASFMRMDKGSNYVLQGILLFLIMFTIFNTILMSVLERQTEFALLLAVGTPPGQLKRQLLVESAYIGFIGCAIGMILGGLSSYAMQVWGIDLNSLMEEGMSVSGFVVSPELRAKVSASVFLWWGGIVFGGTLILCLIPMRRINRVEIVEQLR